jgi:hypothetical protein
VPVITEEATLVDAVSDDVVLTPRIKLVVSTSATLSDRLTLVTVLSVELLTSETIWLCEEVNITLVVMGLVSRVVAVSVRFVVRKSEGPLDADAAAILDVTASARWLEMGFKNVVVASDSNSLIVVPDSDTITARVALSVIFFDALSEKVTTAVE